MNISDRIEKIKSLIKEHEYNFYVLGEKSISSAEMEVLKLELDHLLKEQENLETVC